MTIHNSQSQLLAAWKSLQRQWQASREQWNDPVSRRFEREYFQPLEQTVSATMAEMQKLAQVIAEAQRHVK